MGEEYVILHQEQNVGEDFKLLGITFDSQLKMEHMICEMAAQGHVRISMILRRRRFYQNKTLLWFYKPFVLSYLEFATCIVLKKGC